MTLFCERSRNGEIRNWKFGLHAFVLFFPISNFKFQAVNGYPIFHEKAKKLLDQASDDMKNTG